MQIIKRDIKHLVDILVIIVLSFWKEHYIERSSLLYRGIF